MSQELHYTSAPRGLKPGSRGFCTVACTPGMPGPLADRLESLSGYQQLFPPHHPDVALNPIVYSHLRIPVAGKTVSILSRIGFAGLDYTERANKYAHHIVLDGQEQPVGGPAWVISQPGFLETSWTGEPRILPAGRRPAPGDSTPAVAQAWLSLTGDAGWAGVLAESFLTDPKKVVYLIFQPGMDLLPLISEAVALLPPARRWDVTFSTYYTSLPQGISCAWRCVLDGSPEAKLARRLPDALVLDLTASLGHARGGRLVEQARTGVGYQTDHSPSSASPAHSVATTDASLLPPKLPPNGSSVATGVDSYSVIPSLASGDRYPHTKRLKKKQSMRNTRTSILIMTGILLVIIISTGIVVRHWINKRRSRKPFSPVTARSIVNPTPSVKPKSDSSNVAHKKATSTSPPHTISVQPKSPTNSKSLSEPSPSVVSDIIAHVQKPPKRDKRRIVYMSLPNKKPSAISANHDNLLWNFDLATELKQPLKIEGLLNP